MSEEIIEGLELYGGEKEKEGEDIKDEIPEDPKEMMNDLEQMGVEIQKIRDLVKQLKEKLR